MAIVLAVTLHSNKGDTVSLLCEIVAAVARVLHNIAAAVAITLRVLLDEYCCCA